MKNLIFIIIISISFLTVNAQEITQKSKRELKKERQESRRKEVKKILEDQNFIFFPRQVTPLSGGTIQLDFSFNAEIKGDTINSYLPFYGVAYYENYAPSRGPFDFTLPIKEYMFSKDKNGYKVTFEVKKEQDNISFQFNISKNGYTTLTINSINRQSISYFGTIEKPVKEGDS